MSSPVTSDVTEKIIEADCNDTVNRQDGASATTSTTTTAEEELVVVPTTISSSTPDVEDKDDDVDEATVAVVPPYDPQLALFEREADDRLALSDENDSIRFVVGLSVLVATEDDGHKSLVRDEGDAWDEELMPQANESLQYALLLTNLTAELGSLEDENEKLTAIVEAKQVLLELNTATAAEISKLESLLAAETTKLTAAQDILVTAQSRTKDCPPGDHEDLDCAIRELENVISGGTGSGRGEEEGEAEQEADDVQYPQLVAAWEETSNETLTDSDGHKLFESARYDSCAERITLVATRHSQLCQTIDTLFRNHEGSVLELTEKKQREVHDLLAAFDQDIIAINAPRKRLKQIDDEQQHHIRRGTFIKERQLHISHDELVAERVKNKHTALCDEKLKYEKEISVLSDEVKDQKRTLDNLRRISNNTQAEFDAKRNDYAFDANEFSTTRRTLEEENLDLKELKKDVTKVLQFVKLKNKA